jgi:hypothetical protein
MSKRLSQLTLVPRRNPQLHCVNEKIAGLAAVKPWGDLYAAFSLAAHLATEAIEATEELRQMPRPALGTVFPPRFRLSGDTQGCALYNSRRYALSSSLQAQVLQLWE